MVKGKVLITTICINTYIYIHIYASFIPANPDWIQGKFYRKPEEKGSEQTSSCEDSLKSTHWNIASPRSMFIPLQDGAPPSYQLVYNPHEY